MNSMKEGNNLTVKKQLGLSLPMAFEQLVNILMTVIDTLVVGLLGIEATTSVGAMGVVLSLLFVVSSSIVVSNNVIISNFIGEENNKMIKKYLGNSILLTILLSIILIIITTIISPVLPNIFNVSDKCLIYLYIRLLGFIPLSIGDILCGYERLNKNADFILKLKVFILFINLILDIICVVLNFGIYGIAFVTIIIDLFVMLFLFFKNKRDFVFKLDFKIIKNILKYVKWNIFERMVSKIDVLLMNIIVANISSIEYSVHIILSQMFDLYRDFISGFQNGITINVGIIFGSNNKDKMNLLHQISKKIQRCMIIIVPIIIFSISFIISKIYFKQDLQLNTFYKLLPIIIINSILNVIAIFYYAYLRGIKDFKFLANRNLISSAFKVFVAIIMSKYFGIVGVWLSYFLYSVTQFIMSKKRFEYLKKEF